MLVNNYMEQDSYEEYLVEKGMSFRTRRTYMSMLFGSTGLPKIFKIFSKNHMELYHMLRDYILNNKTKSNRLTAVKSYLTYLELKYNSTKKYKCAETINNVYNKLTRKNLGIIINKKSVLQMEDVEKKLLTEKEFNILNRMCSSDYERLLVKFLLDTGCRIGELAALTLEDIDMSNGNIHINKTYLNKNMNVLPKTDAGHRYVSISQDTLELLKKINFTGFGYYYIYNKVKELCRKGGIRMVNVKTLVTPHWFRHSACTKLLIEGHPIIKVSTYMGHSNPQFTKRVYGRWAISKESVIKR